MAKCGFRDLPQLKVFFREIFLKDVWFGAGFSVHTCSYDAFIR